MRSEQAIALLRSVFEEERAREIITALVGEPTLGDIVLVDGIRMIVTRVDYDELSVMRANGVLGAIKRDRVIKTGENLNEQLGQLFGQIRGNNESISN